MGKKTKIVAIAADPHCGHAAGLAPPAYHVGGGNKRKRAILTVQQQGWRAYLDICKRVKPDIAIWNGDGIDGRGERAGGQEIILPDRQEQADCYQRCIETLGGKKIFMTRGTPYHTGDSENWEDVAAHGVGADIRDHQWIDVNGLVFDVKHKVGGSTIPHGRHTAVARDRLWNTLWAERGLQPKSDIFIRSHVHYHQYAGDSRGLALTTPALQAAAFNRYGARSCSGTIDWGIVVFEVTSKEVWTWRALTVQLAAARVKAHKA